MKNITQSIKNIKQACPVRGRFPKATVSSNGGFIALFSVIIITSVLLLVATTLSLSGFRGRFNIFDSESKKKK